LITRVRVNNFRSIADVDVRLGPLTVLVGRNGAGKSAFLDVLRFVRDAMRSGLENAIVDRHGIASLRRWAPSKPYNVEIAITVEERSFEGEYSFAIVSGKKGTYRVGREACRVSWGTSIEDAFEIRDGRWVTTPERYLRGGRKARPIEPSALAFPIISALSPHFSRMRHALRGSFYHVFPNVLREPQKPSNEKVLTDNGENFASVVRQMRRSEREFRDLVAALRRVADGVSDLRVREVGGYLVTELHRDDLGPQGSRRKQPWFELAQESDGTLRILGILVAFYQGRLKHAILGLEEPENAVHPGALAVISEVIREAAHRNQVLITTQSPDLISTFRINELRVVERINGQTQIACVEEAQRQAIQEQLFLAGDLLRIEGLHGERPSLEGLQGA
jgi:predicted ATPase